MKFSVILIGAMIVLLAAFQAKPGFKVDPNALYQSANEMYFNGELPKNVPVYAAESYDADGKKVIAITHHPIGTHQYEMELSPSLNPTLNYELFSIYHEACHISVMEEAENSNEPMPEPHGSRWQHCMLGLATRGAFHDIW